MMKTTTGSDKLTIILSWVIAILVFAGGAWWIWTMPAPDREQMALEVK